MGILTEAWDGRRRDAAGMAASSGGGSQNGARERLLGWSSGPAEWTSRSVRALCRWSRGQGAAEVAGGGNCREIRLPAGAVSGAKSVRAGVEAVDGGRGDTTGTKAELLRRIRWRRGPGRAGPRRRRGPVRRGDAKRRRRLGFCGGCGWEDEGGAGLRGQLKGAPGILGVRAVEGAARSSARRSGSVGAAEGKGESDEAARWGRLVSGRRARAAGR